MALSCRTPCSSDRCSPNPHSRLAQYARPTCSAASRASLAPVRGGEPPR